MNIPYFRPSIGAEEKAAVNKVLESGWLTTGQAVRNFETAFAAYLGVRHAVALNSCTAALHLALEAAGVRSGDAVLVPAMTFAATAEVVRYLDATPILVDCDPETLCVDPDAMQEAAARWSRRTSLKAMIPMHYGGQMADMFRMRQIADRYGITMIEDAAHALPASIRENAQSPWKSVGTTAPLTCFSFYANKCITTGEGGMLTTDDPELAERVRMMSLHGLSKSAWNRFDTRGSWYYEIVEAGFKYNLTDLAGAIGLEQLKKADMFWQQRRAVAAQYTSMLAEYGDLLDTPPEIENRQSSWHLYPIKLRLDRLGIDRAQFIEELKALGITCSVHWMPLHLHPYYRERYQYKPEHLPVASSVWPRLVSLPIFPNMTEAETAYVCDSVGALVQKHARQSHPVAVCA
jgi:perosamine synthetase